jgi:hypothetical protein
MLFSGKGGREFAGGMTVTDDSTGRVKEDPTFFGRVDRENQICKVVNY